MTTIVLKEMVGGKTHAIRVERLVIAGFTGRDAGVVQEHLDELTALGIAVPESMPSFYQIDPSLVRQTPVVVVASGGSSGEVEPVVVFAGGQWLLTVGSDHTDRDLERRNIAASKAACPKVLGTTCIPVDAIEDWDSIVVTSRIDNDGVVYQAGELSAVLPLEAILDRLKAQEGLECRDGDVLFLGTLPVRGGVRPSGTFSASLSIPGVVGEVALSYSVVDLSSSGRVPLGKPEFEFSDVDVIPWTPVSGGVAGQTERILAVDPASGTATRMLRFEPGTDTSVSGVLRHDFWEEVYILSGELRDLTLNEVFGPGTYACRPPGMPHGPWRSDPGCVTFEVRYPPM